MIIRDRRGENDQKLTADDNFKWLKSPKNAEQEEYRGREEEYKENLVENGENLHQNEGTRQVRTGESRRSRPPLHHAASSQSALLQHIAVAQLDFVREGRRKGPTPDLGGSQKSYLP